MRPRTFLLLILILLVGAFGVLFFLLRGNGASTVLDNLTGGSGITNPIVQDDGSDEPGLPPPLPTPEYNLVPVVVARVPLPVGSRLTADLLNTELRPDTNVALRAGYTFSDTQEIVGRIVGTEIAQGQAILDAMLALSPTDITAIGSDLALQLDQGRVAVAFPINRFSGGAYALRSGDNVDVLMSLTLVDLDEEFQTERPNELEQVDEEALLEGQAFLFPAATEGRLELIPAINLVGVVGPGSDEPRIPRFVTQLTLQQVEVIWAGTWQDPREIEEAREAEVVAIQATAAAIAASDNPNQPVPTLEPVPQRFEDRPDVIIVALTPQDALVLKWALEVGIDIDLVLRAQGDDQVFVTTSVSLPQALEQSGLTIPLPGPLGLDPPVNTIPRPFLPEEPVPEP